MLIEKIKMDFEHRDSRGTLVQLARKGYSQINVITSKGGTLRGGHYHQLNTEAYYMISGSCRVTACKDGEKESAIFRKGDFFRIGPYVSHDFEYMEDSVLVTMYSLGIELGNGEMDIYTPDSERKGGI